MALQHAKSGQPVSLSAAGEQANRVALVKAEEFEAILLKMSAGESLPNHRVNGSITLHCLSGRADLEVEGETQRLEEQSWVFLEGGVPHGLEAITDSTLLLTIILTSAKK